MRDSSIEIVDVTDNPDYERFLYRCIFHDKSESFTKRRHRQEYLEYAVPLGFRKLVLFWKSNYVGMIEYASVEVSGLPITGKDIIVMNCIWVHSKAQGRGFGKRLMENMIENNKQSVGFASLGLEDYWQVYMKKWQMELLGYHSVKSVRLRHKRYKTDRCFSLHLMWLPVTEYSNPPTWDEDKLLEGTIFCLNHPLYHGRYGVNKLQLKEIYEKC